VRMCENKNMFVGRVWQCFRPESTFLMIIDMIRWDNAVQVLVHGQEKGNHDPFMLIHYDAV